VLVNIQKNSIVLCCFICILDQIKTAEKSRKENKELHSFWNDNDREMKDMNNNMQASSICARDAGAMSTNTHLSLPTLHQQQGQQNNGRILCLAQV
jgi:hypothetical protein